MRLSVNLLCVAGFISSAEKTLISLAADAGFDGVEIPMLSGDSSDYLAIGKACDALSLGRTCTAISPDKNTDPTSADENVRSRGLLHQDWILQCAEAMGAETIGGPFHAPIGEFTGQGPTDEEWKRGSEAHHRMAEKAAKLGIKLALEPLNRFETHYLNTAEQARIYVDLVDHPNFGIMYDTFHAHIEEKDQPAAIRHLGDAITVLHVSENDRGIPGSGQIDFPTIMTTMKSIGFDGWVVMEAFGSGLPELAAATRIWRPMFDSHEQLFREGAAYIRKTWDAA
ncbi:MAG: sugar phosphate isomerase/epimerase family protein [Paracoccaceae bacterium]